MYQVKEEPLWLEEAFAALSTSNGNDYESILSHPDKFGATREELQEMLSPYRMYREAVLPELTAIIEGSEGLQFYRDMGRQPYQFLETAVIILQDEKQPDTLLEWTAENEWELEHRFTALIQLMIRPDETWQNEDVSFGSIREVTELLNGVDVPAELRYQLLYLYLNRREFLEALRAVVTPMIAVLKKHFDLIRECFAEQRRELDEDALNMLIQEGGSGFRMSMEEVDVRISLSIFRYNGLSYHEYEQKDARSIALIPVGMFLRRLISGKSQKRELSQAEIQSACKALGDTSRYRILMLILERGRMYLQELAREIGLTPATVSHHISALMEADLLQMEISEQEKRITYYEANRERLVQLGEMFTQMADGSWISTATRI